MPLGIMDVLSAFRNARLKVKITAFTTVLFISAIWALAHDFDEEVRAEFQEVLAAQQFSTVEHIADSLEEAIQERLFVLSDTASLVDPMWLTQPAKLHRFLAEHKAQFRMFNAGRMFISAEGIGLADMPHLDEREAVNYAGSDFFRTVMATGKPAIGKPQRDFFLNEPTVVMGVPIKNGDGRVIAVLAGAVKILGNDLFGEAVSRRLRVGGDLHVVSPKHNLIVTSTDPALALHALPGGGTDVMLDRYREGFEGSGVGFNATGVEELSSAKQVPTTGWIVIAALPTDIAFKSAASIEKEIYIDAAIASVLIALLVWFFLHRQLTPLSRAAASLDAMTQRQTPLRPLEAEGSEEIRHLLESFNRLQARISNQKQLLRENAANLELSARVFENSGESIVITDANECILSVNRAFTEVTGYLPEDVIGQTPRLLSAGRHDSNFYQKMWQTLEQDGHWQGEIWDKRKNGEIYPKWLRISAVKALDGHVTNYIGVFFDISERKQAEARIEFLAYHDTLTGLPNRLLAMDHLELAMAHANRLECKSALVFLDLDNFKSINDSFGHATGDLLLQAVADRLRQCTRTTDTVSRQGGDEFLLILTDVAGTDDITAVTDKILDVLNITFDIEGKELSTSTSMGIAVYPDDGRDIETLLKHADTAMYHAKEAGRNTYRFFTEQMNIDAIEHHRIRIGLLRALERNEFVLHYQPQIDLASGAVIGVEALIRWNHPERGLLPPGVFIQIAEETGLIVQIGDWVLREACRQAASWRQAGLPELVVAVNISAMQFKRGDIEASIGAALEEAGLPAYCLELELTESILIQDTEKVLDTVQRLKSRGLLLSIDDFGTGYSSLAYLKRFNVDKLKIDRSFVADMAMNPSDAAMIRTIIQMARSLNLKTIAEGVEDEHQMAFLRLQYCDEAQGYHIARPMPADQFADFLAQRLPIPI